MVKYQNLFPIDSCKETLFKGADPNKAFDKVKDGLRQKAKELGGQAVINCQFEYRIAVANGFGGSKQVIEIFAYGTAVRLN